ncbi:hypothetical protein, partial [Streptomyces formicae]
MGVEMQQAVKATFDPHSLL